MLCLSKGVIATVETLRYVHYLRNLLRRFCVIQCMQVYLCRSKTYFGRPTCTSWADLRRIRGLRIKYLCAVNPDTCRQYDNSRWLTFHLQCGRNTCKLLRFNSHKKTGDLSFIFLWLKFSVSQTTSKAVD